MKSTILSLLLIIVFSEIGQAQCTYEDIFIVEQGSSNFKVVSTISSMENIKENDEHHLSGYMNRWNKYDYLYGDSVYIRHSDYHYLYHECFHGDKNELQLRFVDDKVYKIKITSTFTGSKFEESTDNYNKLVEIFKKKFTDWDDFIIENSETKEQIGEAYIFLPILTEEKDTKKFNQITIKYRFEYKSNFIMRELKFVDTSIVDKFVIEIIYYNLYGTKLTVEGSL